MIETAIRPGEVHLQQGTAIGKQKGPSEDGAEGGDFAALLAGMLLELNLPLTGEGAEELPTGSAVMVDQVHNSTMLPAGALPTVAELTALESRAEVLEVGEQIQPGGELPLPLTQEQPPAESVATGSNETVPKDQPQTALSGHTDPELKTELRAKTGEIEFEQRPMPIEGEKSPADLPAKELNLELTAVDGETITTSKSHLEPDSLPAEEGVELGPGEKKEQATPAASDLSFSELVSEKLEEDSRISLPEASRLFRQALEQVSRQQGSGRQEVVLKLKPPNLGQVRLVLLHRTGAVSARFEVENDIVRGALQTNMTQLEESLAQQGIEVEELSVFIGHGSADNNQSAPQEDTPDYKPPSAQLESVAALGPNQAKQTSLGAAGTLDLLI